MTKRKEIDSAVQAAMDEHGLSGDLEPTINPPVEGPEAEGLGLAPILAARDLLLEVLTHTHATARLPADLLRRIEEAVA